MSTDTHEEGGAPKATVNQDIQGQLDRLIATPTMQDEITGEVTFSPHPPANELCIIDKYGQVGGEAAALAYLRRLEEMTSESRRADHEEHGYEVRWANARPMRTPSIQDVLNDPDTTKEAGAVIFRAFRAWFVRHRAESAAIMRRWQTYTARYGWAMGVILTIKAFRMLEETTTFLLNVVRRARIDRHQPQLHSRRGILHKSRWKGTWGVDASVAPDAQEEDGLKPPLAPIATEAEAEFVTRAYEVFDRTDQVIVNPEAYLLKAVKNYHNDLRDKDSAHPDLDLVSQRRKGGGEGDEADDSSDGDPDTDLSSLAHRPAKRRRGTSLLPNSRDDLVDPKYSEYASTYAGPTYTNEGPLATRDLSTQTEAEHVETRVLLERAIAKLPAGQGAVATMTLIERLTQAEIASRMDISPQAVSKAWRAAKAKLASDPAIRSLVADLDGELPPPPKHGRAASKGGA